MKHKVARTATEQITTEIANFTQVIVLIQEFLRCHGRGGIRVIVVVVVVMTAAALFGIIVIVIAGVVVAGVVIELQDVFVKVNSMFCITLSSWSSLFRFTTTVIMVVDDAE